MHDQIIQPPDLFAHLEQLLPQVPPGKVTTYGALARALGNVVASRWVGDVLLHDVRTRDWPTHRVLRADGSLGLFSGGSTDAKVRLLMQEGIEFSQQKVDLLRFGQLDFQGPRPLESLQKLQQELAQHVDTSPTVSLPEIIAGLDVSYGKNETAVGAYVLCDAHSGDMLWSHVISAPAAFPYISSYLSFREVPMHLQLLAAAKEAGKLADVLLVDGAGILHPRRIGSASHLGVVSERVTIGVTKTQSAGTTLKSELAAGEVCDVVKHGETLGVATRPRASTKKCLYISPGHRLNVASSAAIVKALLKGRFLPEPIYWADRLSREAVRQNT